MLVSCSYFYFIRAATLVPKREFSSSTRTNPPDSMSNSLVEPEYSNFTINKRKRVIRNKEIRLIWKRSVGLIVEEKERIDYLGDEKNRMCVYVCLCE